MENVKKLSQLHFHFKFIINLGKFSTFFIEQLIWAPLLICIWINFYFGNTSCLDISFCLIILTFFNNHIDLPIFIGSPISLDLPIIIILSFFCRFVISYHNNFLSCFVFVYRINFCCWFVSDHRHVNFCHFDMFTWDIFLHNHFNIIIKKLCTSWTIWA